jgi:hypothetical protein
MNAKKILLISPSFFNYEKRIETELIKQGYCVTLLNDRVSNGFFYKVSLRCFPSLISRLSEVFYLKKIKELCNQSFECIVVIKGEALSEKIIKELLIQIKHTKNCYYLWDSINNTFNSINKAKHFQCVATFDPVDAKNQKWKYLPLFASTKETVTNAPYKWDICFIGTAHSDRLKILQKIKNNLNFENNLFCFAYIPSRVILWIKKAIFPVFKKFNNTELSTKPMPYSDVITTFNTSRAIIDIEHFGQNGLTMRSIEVLLSGKKLITTNKTILQSDLYHPSRVLLIDREHPIINSEFLQSIIEPIDNRLKSIYSIDNFVKQLCL